ncbi:hypothetical protein D3C80_643100 [compost metagenome]
MAGEALGIYGGRGDDHLEIRAPWQQLLQVAQDEVDVEAALVGLIDDDGVVLGQHAVVLDLRQQDTVCHQLDVGLLAHLIGKAHLVTHVMPKFGLHLFGNTGRHGAGRQTPRLGVADVALDPAPQRQTDFRDLGGLARAGFTGDDHHLMFTDRLCDLRLLLADRQVVRVSDPGHARQTGLIARFGHRQIGC